MSLISCKLDKRWGGAPLIAGIVLLSAAALKAHPLLSAPSPGEGLLHSFWIQVIAIEVEFACGLALLVRFRPRWTRKVVMFLFAAFFGVALFQALTGVSACACWGKIIKLNPWLAVLLDLGLLGALWRWRPETVVPEEFKGFFVRRDLLAVGACLALFAALPFALAGFAEKSGSLQLEVFPKKTDLGILIQGQRAVFYVELRNPHNHPVMVHRVKTTCPCLEGMDFPLQLAGGEEKQVGFALDLGKEPEFCGRLLIEFSGETQGQGFVFGGKVGVKVVQEKRLAADFE